MSNIHNEVIRFYLNGDSELQIIQKINFRTKQRRESLSETISQIIDECFVADGEDSDYIKIEEFVEYWDLKSINYSVDNLLLKLDQNDLIQRSKDRDSEEEIWMPTYHGHQFGLRLFDDDPVEIAFPIHLQFKESIELGEYFLED
jgi:hypothetical protein